MESKQAAQKIIALLPKLQEDEASEVLRRLIIDTAPPGWKRKYLNQSDRCPFCGNEDFVSGNPDPDGRNAHADCECRKCGHSWREVWVLADVMDAYSKDGEPVEDGSTPE